MKTFLVLLALLIVPITAHVACAAEAVPERAHAPAHEPPPFVPPGVNPAQDLDRLMHILDDDDDDKKPAVLKCDAKPCVFGYRLNGPIDDTAAGKFEKFIAAATAAHADAVMVEIDTPGGSIDSGHEISRQIEHAPLMVACVVDGEAYSMGMYILQSCDQRVMTKRSSLMIHQASLRAPMGARLTQKSMDDLKVQITVITRGYIEWVGHRMKVSIADILKRVDNGGEWFMNWDEAVKVGAVDRAIVGPPEAYFSLLKKGQR